MSATTEFVLISRWDLPASRNRVWNALHEPAGWPGWWPCVADVEKIGFGDSQGIGARYRFHWTSRLPYSIRLLTRVVEVVPQQLIRASAEGDLCGEGCWRLADTAHGTRAEYTWQVGLDKRWMRALAPLLRPIFAWNHNAVMAAGETGLREFLHARGSGQ